MADLIWPLAFLIVAMTAVLGLLGPARRSLRLLGDSLAGTQAERDAKAALDLAEAEESRHKLAVRREHLADEVRFEQARLAAETARLETDAEAARQCLPAAVAAREAALKARAEAEAALAPEAARKALEESPAWLAEAYAAYCEHSYSSAVLPFGRWIQGYDGGSYA